MEDSSSQIIPRDTSTDIFFHIATKLSDRELLPLFPMFSEQIRSLSQNNEFWYRRSEYLAGKNLQPRSEVDWKRIYYTLFYTLEDYDSSESYVPPWRHLDYIPSLYVLVEIFGTPAWDEFLQEGVWLQVHTPEVLTYLLNLGYLEDGPRYEVEALKSSAKEGRLEMVIHLLDMIDRTTSDENSSEEDDIAELHHDNIQEVTINAVEQGHVAIVKYIFERDNDYGDPDIMMDSAIEGGHKNMIRYLYEVYNNDLELLFYLTLKLDSIPALEVLLEQDYDVENIFSEALEEGRENIVQYLLENNLISQENIDWQQMISAAIHLRHRSLLEYLLTIAKNISSSHARDIMLKSAYSRPDIFRTVLSHPEMDPSQYIGDILGIIIEISTTHIREETADLLARDKRIRVEDLSSRHFSILLTLLGRRIKNLIYEYKIRRAAIDRTNSKLYEDLKKDTIYALILRFIFIKKPSSTELIDWMIEQKNELIIEARRSIIEGYIPIQSEVQVIRGLLLYIPHPDIMLWNQIDYLREEGMSNEDIDSCLMLIRIFSEARKNG